MNAITGMNAGAAVYIRKICNDIHIGIIIYCENRSKMDVGTTFFMGFIHMRFLAKKSHFTGCPT